ncbi:tigger transposable element-derived protein 4-like [Bacillus rossius redtenbacheri]|uniref:tigger transposable element-derived protein 4-like n=1 Tax=Bacillus rossius redtenbacheri TaxID=93214 RepID=UPI002FDE25A4
MDRYKVPRNTLSIEDKIKIIEKFDKHVGTRVVLAKELNIPVSTLNTIIKNRCSIEANAAQCGPSAKKRKYVKDSTFKELESLLYEWFICARSSNLPINGNVLREKAKVIALRLGIDDFSASNGWIDRFRQRHNVVYKVVCGESKSVDEETADVWKNTSLKEQLEGYSAKDVFNADETGLFYCVLPNKTLCFKGEKCHGGKLSKNRITILLLTNADGSEKFPLFVIGKSKKPRCFKNIKTLPTLYEANNKSWMTGSLFQQQIQAFDRKMALRNRNVLLFIDQCPAHKINIELRNVKIVYFPANCTSTLQPLDLGIINSFKCYYRKCIVSRAVAMLDVMYIV